MSFTHLKAAQDAAKLHPDLEVFSKEHPRSVYNLVPDYVKESMDQIPQAFLLLSWVQLRKEVEPDLTLERLRQNFWLEFQRAQATMTRMNMSNVYTEIMPSSTFRDLVKNHMKLAWLLSPPVDYASGMRSILEHGMNLMFDVITHPSIFSEGKVNIALVTQALKIIDKAIVAVHGLPTIRTENKTMNVNVNAAPTAAHLDLEEKRKELERLKAAREVRPITEGNDEV